MMPDVSRTPSDVVVGYYRDPALIPADNKIMGLSPALNAAMPVETLFPCVVGCTPPEKLQTLYAAASVELHPDTTLPLPKRISTVFAALGKAVDGRTTLAAEDVIACDDPIGTARVLLESGKFAMFGSGSKSAVEKAVLEARATRLNESLKSGEGMMSRLPGKFRDINGRYRSPASYMGCRTIDDFAAQLQFTEFPQEFRQRIDVTLRHLQTFKGHTVPESLKKEVNWLITNLPDDFGLAANYARLAGQVDGKFVTETYGKRYPPLNSDKLVNTISGMESSASSFGYPDLTLEAYLMRLTGEGVPGRVTAGLREVAAAIQKGDRRQFSDIVNGLVGKFDYLEKLLESTGLREALRGALPKETSQATFKENPVGMTGLESLDHARSLAASFGVRGQFIWNPTAEAVATLGGEAKLPDHMGAKYFALIGKFNRGDQSAKAELDAMTSGERNLLASAFPPGDLEGGSVSTADLAREAVNSAPTVYALLMEADRYARETLIKSTSRLDTSQEVVWLTFLNGQLGNFLPKAQLARFEQYLLSVQRGTRPSLYSKLSGHPDSYAHGITPR